VPEESERLAREHVDRFNAAVIGGDWSALVATFHPDAVMEFAGPPVGRFVGREAIAAAYQADPPDDTMRVRSVDAGLVAFEWSRGGTGTMEIHRDGGPITRLLIRFDRPPGLSPTRA
jgi:steroid Delta-isomerase